MRIADEHKGTRILNLTVLSAMAAKHRRVFADHWHGPIGASLALSFTGVRLINLFKQGLYEYKE
jgi:hypothetical protein